MVSAAPLTESSVRFRGDAFTAAREALLDGGVALVPTDTVYGLAVHPRRPAAIDALFALKDRPRTRELPIMVATPDELPALGVQVTEPARRLLAAFSPGPLTVALGIDPAVAPDWLAGRDEIGVRVPSDPDLRALLSDVGPLLVTSANAHGEPTAQAPGPILDAARRASGRGRRRRGAFGGAVDGRQLPSGRAPHRAGGRGRRRRDREGARGERSDGRGDRRMTAVLPADGLMLGIETSCDDTGVAVVRPDGEVVAAAVASQVELHDRYGGVYPEMASRAHVDAILPTVRKVLTDADLRPADLTAIGVTRGPGLIGSLVVGTNSAVGLGDGWGLPVYGVNHLRGHLRSADLDERRVEYPAMVLLVSGGHTLLAHVQASGDVALVGSTRDDSVGEAYDKVARMLGLGYPGGPAIDRLAKSGTADVPVPAPGEGPRARLLLLRAEVQSVSRFLAANPDHAPETSRRRSSTPASTCSSASAAGRWRGTRAAASSSWAGWRRARSCGPRPSSSATSPGWRCACRRCAGRPTTAP